jgi:hypothetical protein
VDATRAISEIRMNHDETYRGRHIFVSTRNVGHGYTWSYTIDGEHYKEQLGDRPQPEEMALREGIGEARLAVDRMPRAE